MKSRHWSCLTGLGALFAISLAGCSQQPPQAPEHHPSVRAQVMTVTVGQGISYEPVPGTVLPTEQVQLSSRLSGYLHGLKVHVGQSVQAGQLLFQVDPRQVDSQVAQAQAGLAQAQANLADAKSNYQRFQKLYQAQAIPEKQWDQIKSQYETARAQVAAAMAEAGSAQSQLRYARVTAPFAGIITEKFLQDGDLVAPGRPVLTLANPNVLEVQCSVGSRAFALLSLGERIPVQANGRLLEARVQDLVPVADPMTHSHLVKLSLPSPDGVQAGDFVQVQIPDSENSNASLQIPSTALLNRAGIPGVFVVNEHGIAEYRMVRPGVVSGGQVTILAGLNPGDRIVVKNAAAVNNGDRIVQIEGSHD